MPEIEGKLLKAIAICAEVCGTELSKGAMIFIEQELAKYPDNVAMSALSRTAKECKGRFSLAEVLSRIDDGRLSADEAWTLVPMDEDTTTVWTNEMSEAWGACRDLIDHDKIAARMAFKGAYDRIVIRNKNKGISPHWQVSLGFDKDGRVEPITNAVQLGRIGKNSAIGFLPEYKEEILAIEYEKTNDVLCLEEL